MSHEKLKELANNATQGEWWIDSHGHEMISMDSFEVIFVHDDSKRPAIRHDSTGNLSHWRNDVDASYIAAACPKNILALLAERDALMSALRAIAHKSAPEQDRSNRAIYSIATDAITLYDKGEENS